ncbi:protein-glutamate O-methyltransferase CheR, partial [Candidatus Poribacteria bacterium]|nr:protein-glutamate O-methyltransferase CheR [Candidatus Poribacteria bacterium]
MSLNEDVDLMKLLTKIYDVKKLDFSQYKEKTLFRRIKSRMDRFDVKSYAEYIKIIEKEPDEINKLINALTINVTEFFRNPESFKAIEKIVIPRIILSKRSHRHMVIKAWSCGCSSGDEPYSIAILLLEKLGKAKDKFIINIFGTDIDNNALDEAKNMVYSKDRLKAIGNNILKKYFVNIDNDNYKLIDEASKLVKLKKHDIINDHPILHCDMILCRNLLIYFNPQLQQDILLKFYDCLNPGGFLVLGMTESLYGEASKKFKCIDNRLRIYMRPENDISLQN